MPLVTSRETAIPADYARAVKARQQAMWASGDFAAARTFRYQSAEHWVDVFGTFYGPTHTAFRALDAEGQAGLEADLIALLRSHDVGGPDGLVVPGEYLETVIRT